MALNDYFTDLDWNDCHQVKEICGCGTNNPGKIISTFEPCKLGWNFDPSTCECEAPGCYQYISTVYYRPIPGCNPDNINAGLRRHESVIFWWYGMLISSNVPTFGGFLYWSPRCTFLQARGVLWTDFCAYRLCDGTEYSGDGRCANNSHAVDAGSVNAYAATLSVRNFTYNEQTERYEAVGTSGLAAYVQTGELAIQPGSSRPKPVWEQVPFNDFTPDA